MMNTDRQYNGLQLISPPPEESLRRQLKVFSPAVKVKRKRSRAPAEGPQPLTPNPRSRKQVKQRDTPGSPSPLKPRRAVQSPHAQNPSADYIPPTTLVLSDAGPINKPLSRTSRSTSATPIPPYDPPTDIFTPPKEVFVTPVTATIKVSKSSKRKSTTKKKRPTPTPVVVKLEMPDVDLDAPMPPPSPGDDPLLLSSSVEPPTSTPTRPRTKSPWAAFSESDALPMDRDVDVRPIRRTISPTPLPFHKLRFVDLPPSSPPDENLDQDQPSPIVEDEDLDITPPDMPFFDFGGNANADDGWSDSGDELPMLPPPEASPTKEGEGEFTGKWLEVLVRTKADPPSSATKGRIDEWGNPKSPFPLSLEKRRPDLDAVKETGEREEEGVISRMSVEPEEELNPFDFRGIESLPDERQEAMSIEADSHQEEEQREEEATEEYAIPLRDEEGSPIPGTPHTHAIEVDEDIVEEGPTAEDAFRLMGNEPVLSDEDVDVEEELSEEILHDDDTQEEAQITIDDDQHTSIEEEEPDSSDYVLPPPEQELKRPRPSQAQPEARIEIEVDHEPDLSDEDIPSSSSDTSPSPDIVKITSADPRAAARAAAILKQHNYDCFTKMEMKKRYSDVVRRKSSFSPGASTSFAGISARGVLGGGIVKEKERRRTIGGGMMGVRGEKVYIPGSPVTTTLPRLLKDAEAEVSLSLNMSNLSMSSAPEFCASSGSPNPFVLRTHIPDVDSYKTPLPSKVFSPIPMNTEGSMTGLANRMDKSLVLLTPKVPMTPGETCYDPLTGERMWTKEEWKRLDACFTDERLEVGAKLGLIPFDPTGILDGINGETGWEKCKGMASADDVKLEDVLKRFVDWMGGQREVESYGPEWSRENLISRTRALRSKQRNGNVAPPTSLPFSPASRSSNALATLVSPSPFDFGSFGDRSMSVEMDIPDFTPIKRRPLPLFSRLKRQWSSIGTSSSAPGNLNQGEMELCPATTSTPLSRQDTMKATTSKPVPASLLAPRYSHLLEEAVKVSKDLPDVAKSLDVDVDVRTEEEERGQDYGLEQETQSDTVLEEEQEAGSEGSPTTLVEEEHSFGSEVDEEEVEVEYEEVEQEPEEPATIGKRVKGIIFSYLPTLKKTPSKDSTSNERPKKLRARPSHRPGFPLPPKEVLSKPRGPVVTPAREPIPKSVHPKELVHLQQAPPVQPPASKIPRVVHPKQLVELNHVTPKVASDERQRRQRRSSNSSVKDLIKGFEQMDKENGKGTRGSLDGTREVKRMKSVGEWRKDVGTASTRSSGESGRPLWKP